MRSEDPVVGHRKVRRRDLRRRREPSPLRRPDHLDAALRADVRRVKASADEAKEREVPGDDGLFRRRRVAGEPEPRRDGAFVHAQPRRDGVVFAVVHHGQPEFARVQERGLHQPPGRHGAAVVREPHDSRLREFLHIREFRAVASFGDGAEDEHADGPGLPRPLRDEFDHCGGINGGERVGHRAHRREASRRRRRRPRLDGLLVLEARLPEVRVQVDEAGRRDEPSAVENDGVLGGRLRRVGDQPAADEQVADAVGARGGVHHAGAAQEDRPAHSAPPSRPPVSS